MAKATEGKRIYSGLAIRGRRTHDVKAEAWQQAENMGAGAETGIEAENSQLEL